jgi:hypothetical protein
MKPRKVLSLGLIPCLLAGSLSPLLGQERKRGQVESVARGSVETNRSKATPPPGAKSSRPGGVSGTARTGTRRATAPRTRQRSYRGVSVSRRHGHWYHGYGHHNNDSNAWKWLAFTAITLKLLDNINEAQQRKHEAAQIDAATAPIGEAIAWQEGDASGRVTATKEAQDSSGNHCREFQQEITVGGQTEQAYGTACLQPDGAWKIVSD